MVTQLRARIDQGIADGDVPTGVDTEAVAMFYATVLNGLSVQARDGHPRALLRVAADAALATWNHLVGPTSPSGTGQNSAPS